MGCYFNREAHLARGHKIIGAPFRKPDISAGVAAYLAHNGERLHGRCDVGKRFIQVAPSGHQFFSCTYRQRAGRAKPTRSEKTSMSPLHGRFTCRTAKPRLGAVIGDGPLLNR
jgi:hypothetical protein